MGYCVICKNHFGWDWKSGNKIFLEDREWKLQRKANSDQSGNLQRQICLDARALEEKYFKNRYQTHTWIELYRLSMFLPFFSHLNYSIESNVNYHKVFYDNAEKRYRISGIGHYDPEYGIRNAAAKKYEEALIGKVNGLERIKKTTTTEYYSVTRFSWWLYTSQIDEDTRRKVIYTHWGNLPLAIHMSCWKLAQWVLGPSLLDHDKNLELFAGIMFKFMVRQSLVWHHNQELVHLHLSGDPYRIPKVQQLIARSREEKKRRRRPRKGKPRSSLISRLPIEILELILDHLTVIETLKLEKALLIVVGEKYWRHRASWDLMEIDELAGEEEQIDWRYLCTNLDRMIKRDESFQNRNHVVGILRDHIKPEFLRKLGEGDSPSLKQVIVEYQQKKAKIAG